MKLLSITLDGEYKGLRSDTFDFSQSEGRLLAFIGLNGSGKSQLLELIAETFAFLERKQRQDFKTKKTLGFGMSLIYEINTDVEQLSSNLQMLVALSTTRTQPTFKVIITEDSTVEAFFLVNDDWETIEFKYLELPDYIIGYSSGLNENLQRSFMKNAVQYNEVMRARLSWRKKFEGNVDEEGIIAINKEHLQKYPELYDMPAYAQLEENDFLTLRESVSPIPSLLFMDYDSNSLLVASLCLLPEVELHGLLSEVRYKKPTLLELRFNLRGGIANEDVIRDIKLLIRLAGEDNVKGEGKEASDEQYNLFEMQHLSGLITFDLSSNAVRERLNEAHFGGPIAFFRRLYRLQLAGVNNWEGATRNKLKQCDFKGTVKKPQKSKLPLSVERLDLANEHGHCVNFDDFSDGEAQLIQILAAARIFRDEQTLFLFDEPETHLNPSWRTYFHQHLAQANKVDNVWTQSTQTILSTHSPFMISSLKKSEVYRFERDDDGFIRMNRAENQTYGASFDVLIKEYFNLKSLISQTVVEDIKAHLPKGDSQEEKETARVWLNENLGESMEKAYLLRKLQD